MSELNEMCEMCLNFTCARTGDYQVWLVVGHHPDCPEFKIDRKIFVENFHALLQQKTEEELNKRLLVEMPKLKAMYEPKIKPTGLTESNLQTRLFHWLERKGHFSICPNISLFDTGEMDLCSVMQSHKVNEYEIKLTRKDFKADFNKTNKHSLLEKLYRRRVDSNGKILAANFFYYVVPRQLITPDEVPAYAGLIYVNPKNLYQFETVKKAPLLHSETIQIPHRLQISAALMNRLFTAKDEIERLKRQSSINIEVSEQK